MWTYINEKSLTWKSSTQAFNKKSIAKKTKVFDLRKMLPLKLYVRNAWRIKKKILIADNFSNFYNSFFIPEIAVSNTPTSDDGILFHVLKKIIMLRPIVVLVPEIEILKFLIFILVFGECNSKNTPLISTSGRYWIIKDYWFDFSSSIWHISKFNFQIKSLFYTVLFRKIISFHKA